MPESWTRINGWWPCAIIRPPIIQGGRDVTELMAAYQVSDVVYGHIHGYACAGAFNGTVSGVRYHCVSCDCLGFKLLALPDEESRSNPKPGESPKNQKLSYQAKLHQFDQ